MTRALDFSSEGWRVSRPALSRRVVSSDKKLDIMLGGLLCDGLASHPSLYAGYPVMD